jgi:hypothetical protein
MEEEETPFWRTIGDVPDDRFPIGLRHFPLIEVPDRGTQVVVTCCVCRKKGCFTGLDLIRQFPGWLTHDACEWACSLRCDSCGERRLKLCLMDHPAAQGFRAGAQDTSDVIRIRRLLAWLPEGGLRLDDVAYLLRDINHVNLKSAGLPQDVIQFFSYGAHHCEGYLPKSRRPIAAD